MRTLQAVGHGVWPVLMQGCPRWRAGVAYDERTSDAVVNPCRLDSRGARTITQARPSIVLASRILTVWMPHG